MITSFSVFRFVQKKRIYLFQRVVFLVRNRLQPFGSGFLAGAFHRQMTEPAVSLCSVPMLDICGDRYNVAGFQALSGLAVLLVPALAVHTDKQLSAARFSVMDMPIVAAARLKGNIRDKDRLLGVGKRFEIAVADKEFRIIDIWLAQSEKAAVFLGAVLRVDLLCKPKRRPRVRSTRVKSQMC